MKHEKSRIWWFIGVFLSILVMMIGIAVNITAIEVFGFVILGVSYIQAYIFCRCPYCSHSFMAIGGLMRIRLIIEMPKYCPNCGKEVN